LTVRFFGELDRTDVARAVDSLGRAAASVHGPVDAIGGPATRFLGPGLVVWPVEGLSGVARAVEAATAAIGQPPPDRRFFGHLTIARARTSVDLRRSPHLLAPLTSSWSPVSLSLVQSELRPDGARYNDVASFALGEQQEEI
jgi:2'-5' RNA ligase